MGITRLWSTLQDTRIVKHLEGASAALDIAKAVDGKRVAVDLSIWQFEASKQPELYAAFKNDETTVCMKLVFERACSWLRYGVTPVFVMEGAFSHAKAGRFVQRAYGMSAGAASEHVSTQRASSQAYSSHSNNSRIPHNPITNHVASLVNAMGLPVVQAQGEAEAMCAALNAIGLVDAVQTKDVDALVFGAKTVYKQLKLNYGNPKMSEATVCDMSDIRQALGLQQGGVQALRVLAAMAGGDYNVSGISDVGTGKALDAVRGLLAQGQVDDSGLQAALIHHLDTGPDPHLLSLTNCTGCKTCGHESGTRNSKKKHGAAGCTSCGTTTGCNPKPAGSECMCDFHRRKHERYLAKVLQSAQQNPEVKADIIAALQEYDRQTRMAMEAARKLEGTDFNWRTRPDCDKISKLLSQATLLDWTPELVRLKLRPVMIQWDLLQGPAGGPDVEWRPTSIQKVQGESRKPDSQSWRVVLQLERLPGTGTPEEQQQDRDWLAGITPRQRHVTDGTAASVFSQPPSTATQMLSSSQIAGLYSIPSEDVDEGDSDSENVAGGTQAVSGQAASSKGSQRKSAPPPQRTFNVSVVARHWPQLLASYQQTQMAKMQGKGKKSSSASSKSKGGSGKGAAAVEHGQATIPAMFAARKARPPSDVQPKQGDQDADGAAGQAIGDVDRKYDVAVSQSDQKHTVQQDTKRESKTLATYFRSKKHTKVVAFKDTSETAGKSGEGSGAYHNDVQYKSDVVNTVAPSSPSASNTATDKSGETPAARGSKRASKSKIIIDLNTPPSEKQALSYNVTKSAVTEIIDLLSSDDDGDKDVQPPVAGPGEVSPGKRQGSKAPGSPAKRQVAGPPRRSVVIANGEQSN